MNKLQFKNKININGNTKLLDVDMDNKTFEYGYCFRRSYEEDIVLSSKEMKKLICQLESLGFERVDK